MWEQRQNISTHAICEECIQSKAHAGSLPQANFLCRECRKQLPMENFDITFLRKLCQAQELWRLVCMNCKDTKEKPNRIVSTSQSTEPKWLCGRCDRHKPAVEFAIAVRKYLQKNRANIRCFECQYPLCCSCGKRPARAYFHHYKDGEYMCKSCGYPPCPACGKPRPQLNSGRWHVRNKPDWRCTECSQATSKKDK